MGKDSFRFAYDPVAAFRNCPKILGMELTQRGKQLEGGYYLNGEPHPYRKDKIKVYIQNGTVWVSEEGGECVSLTQWLIDYGGAEDFKAANRIINGQGQALHWTGETRRHEAPAQKFVPIEAVRGAANYDLHKCPLFNWMCQMFPEERVREVWKQYNVTTDSHGNTVYWYVDKDGKVLFDKRILYKNDGHRDKEFHPGRQYRIADGYTGRCYFGDNVPDDGKKAFICESEKTAILGTLYYGRRFLATGGKSNLRDVNENCLLLPDMDARDKWAEKGEVWPWWEKWDGQVPDHADIGDYIEWKLLKNK